MKGAFFSAAIAAFCIAFLCFFGMIAIALLFPAHNTTDDPLLMRILAICVISFTIAALLGIIGVALYVIQNEGKSS